MRSFAERVAEREGDTDRYLGVAGLPGAPQPTDTHVALVNLLDRILEMGAASDTQGGHPALRASLRFIRKMKPVAVEEIARVPEDEVRGFIANLIAEMAGAVSAVCPHCGLPWSRGPAAHPPADDVGEAVSPST
jgi:hypothetical protein